MLGRLARTPSNAPTRSGLVPPQTQAVPFDETGAFGGKKQKPCAAAAPADARRGDCWDPVAFAPEHRLGVSAVVGKRPEENARPLVDEFRERSDGRPVNLMTSDDYPAYAAALAALYAAPMPPASGGEPEPPGPLPEWLTYATVPKTRENNRVVQGATRVVFGTRLSVAAALLSSVVSWCVNTGFRERSHGSDRHRHSRKGRTTDRVSKAWGVQEAMSYCTLSSSNGCWCVRTLRQPLGEGRYLPRTPAMAAGLGEHVWSLAEWLTVPGNKRYRLPAMSPK
jgi:hypothetical protein